MLNAEEYTPKEFNPIGIREQIKRADSFAEVQSLITHLKGYKDANPATIRRCERLAKVKMEEFQAGAKKKHS